MATGAPRATPGSRSHAHSLPAWAGIQRVGRLGDLWACHPASLASGRKAARPDSAKALLPRGGGLCKVSAETASGPSPLKS